MHTRLLVLVAVALGFACDGKDDTASGDESDADTDADTDTDTDADTDTDTDADTDTDTDPWFLTAKGTFDGEPFTLDCPPGTLSGARSDATGGTRISAVCSHEAKGVYRGLTLSALDVAKGEITTCSYTSFILVVEGPSAGAIEDYVYNCTKGWTEYSLNTTEVSSSAKSTIWAGTFAVAGVDVGSHGTNSVDVSGSFLVEAVASE